MNWWDIIKSSRNEAYSAFLEEFGPEVDLKFLELENHLDDPENVDVYYYLSVSNVSGKKLARWDIQSNGDDIRFVSDTYPQHGVFVKGMFQQEYPERYQEIVDMFKGDLPQAEVNSFDFPTYQVIIELIEKKIRDLGLLDDTDYATVHDMPFTEVLEMALKELKERDWPPPGSPLPRTDTRIKMFDAVLDEFNYIYTSLQKNALTYRDRAERRVETNRRRRALRNLLESSFIVTYEKIAPREPYSNFLSEVLTIIKVEMNLAGD